MILRWSVTPPRAPIEGTTHIVASSNQIRHLRRESYFPVSLRHCGRRWREGGKERLTCSPEHDRGVHRDTRNANPFLNDLQPYDEVCAASDVHAALATASHHGPVVRSTVNLHEPFLGLHGSDNFVKLLLRARPTYPTSPTQRIKHVPGFFVAALLCQPARRFGEEPDHAEENN